MTEITELIEGEEAPVEIAEEVEETPVAIEAATPNPKSKVKTASGDVPEGWFDGYGTPDLRAFLRYWKNDKRSKGAAEALASQDERYAGMTAADHVAMIEAELVARDATRSKGGPTG